MTYHILFHPLYEEWQDSQPQNIQNAADKAFAALETAGLQLILGTKLCKPLSEYGFDDSVGLFELRKGGKLYVLRIAFYETEIDEIDDELIPEDIEYSEGDKFYLVLVGGDKKGKNQTEFYNDLIADARKRLVELLK